MNDATASALARLIQQYGLALIGEPARLRSLLYDECPESKREISALLQAQEEGIPDDLQRIHSGEPLRSLGARLTRRLSTQRALASEAADWAVRAWAQALGIDLGADAGVGPATDAGPLAADMVSKTETVAAPAQPITGPTGPMAWWQTLAARSRVMVVGGVVALAGAFGWLMSPGTHLEITQIEMPERFVADGKRRDVLVTFQARNTTARSVDIRFVSGDGKWNPNAWSVNLPAGAVTQGRASLGGMSYSSQQPARSTFEFVLVAQDGRRSAPFTKTFDIEPAPATPPRITGVTIPRLIYVGREFSATIAFEDPDGDVVKLERRVVESTSSAWAPEVVTQEFPALQGKRSGAAIYAFPASPVSHKSAVEFVLIDARGNRSEPRRVAMEVLAAPASPPSNTRVDLPQSPRAPAVVPPAGGPSRQNCVPPGHLSPGERWAWFQRYCLGIRR